MARRIQTPNLDKLAAEGIRFTNYLAADSASVTRASLMLGKNYPAASHDIPLAPSRHARAGIAIGGIPHRLYRRMGFR